MNTNTKPSKALVKTDVSSSLSISEIKERLDNCIDLYTDLFCQKQEVYADGWIGEIKGGINCFADAFLSFDDIVSFITFPFSENSRIKLKLLSRIALTSNSLNHSLEIVSNLSIDLNLSISFTSSVFRALQPENRSAVIVAKKK